MISIKQIIFGFFGSYEKRIDTNKDGAGKGTLERFNEAIGEEYDVEMQPLIDALMDNVQNPTACFERYIPLLELGSGNDRLYLSSGYPIRRAIQHYILRYWQIKGTKKFLESLLSFIGFNVSLTEFYSSYSFDSPVTFDDDDRRFDMKCQPCSDYKLDLSRIGGGTGAMTPTEIAAVLSIVTTNQPINAVLKGIWYNGTQII